MKELFQVVTVGQAQQILADKWQPQAVPKEEVGLDKALGRVLADAVNTSGAIPGFRRATVDGFAVRAQDTFGASEGMPAYLTVVGEIAMGEEPQRGLASGECQAIATGGMLPPGADGVVMVEHTESLDETTLGILRPLAPGDNVIQQGEDLAPGSLVVAAGQLLRPMDIGSLAAIGMVKVPVVARPSVAIISTGDELVPPSQDPRPGQIRDVNTYALGGAVEQAGGTVVGRWVVQDRYDLLRAALADALAVAQVVVVSGGSSVGKRDHTAQLIADLGEPGVIAHGVAIKPGKPTIIGLLQGKPVFGLSGNPVSALITFGLFVVPVLVRLQGQKPRPSATVAAILAKNIASAAGREDFVRVVLDWTGPEVIAEPVLGKTGLIATMAKAHGLVRVPLTKEGLLAGEVVDVELF